MCICVSESERQLLEHLTSLHDNLKRNQLFYPEDECTFHIPSALDYSLKHSQVTNQKQQNRCLRYYKYMFVLLLIISVLKKT